MPPTAKVNLNLKRPHILSTPNCYFNYLASKPVTDFETEKILIEFARSELRKLIASQPIAGQKYHEMLNAKLTMPKPKPIMSEETAPDGEYLLVSEILDEMNLPYKNAPRFKRIGWLGSLVKQQFMESFGRVPKLEGTRHVYRRGKEIDFVKSVILSICEGMKLLKST